MLYCIFTLLGFIFGSGTDPILLLIFSFFFGRPLQKARGRIRRFKLDWDEIMKFGHIFLPVNMH